MDNNDSNIKPQQTGGLKLTTVFFAVFALHVVVICAIIVCYLTKGGSADADLATLDKTHRSLNGSATADVSLPDASQSDKSVPGAQTATPPTEIATIPQAASGPQAASSPANPPTPAPDAAAPTVAITPAPAVAPIPASTPASAPTLAQTTSQPLTPAASTVVADQVAQTPTAPISPQLAPPAEPTLAPVTPAPDISVPAPSASMASGPVHMPPVESPAPVSQEIYVVKITDSYKKIAHRHHITVTELKEANHIKGDVLHTGQKLMIPSEKKLVAESAPTSASTLALASTGPILSESTAPMTTSLTSASSTVTTTSLHHHLYTVVKGDTLTRIAHKFRTTATALMAENGITDPTKLTIGKKLRIPSEESRSARNGAPASTPPGQEQAKENAPTAQLANYVH